MKYIIGLHPILKDLCNEFLEKQSEFLNLSNFSKNLKIGTFGLPGTKRNKMGQFQNGIVYNIHFFYQDFTYFLTPFESAKKLHEYLLVNNLWHDDMENLGGNTLSLPNEIGRQVLVGNVLISL